MKYTVLKRHKSNYPDPITLKKGEKVKLDKKYDGPEDWLNWIYCYKLNSSQQGWIPEQIIRKTGEYGIVEKDYTAKELDVEEGEQVDGSMEINGWVWCRRNMNYEEGWVPKSNLIKNK